MRSAPDRLAKKKKNSPPLTEEEKKAKELAEHQRLASRFLKLFIEIQVIDKSSKEVLASKLIHLANEQSVIAFFCEEVDLDGK